MPHTTLSSLAKKAQNLSAIIAFVATICVGVWWIAEDKVRQIARNLVIESVDKCATIPASGHLIETAPAGSWGVVEWVAVERHADCGIPEITGVISNGDGILHDLELSTEGINYPVGIHNIRYAFLVPKNVKSGRAYLMVTVNYPDAGQTINTPRIPFEIPES